MHLLELFNSSFGGRAGQIALQYDTPQGDVASLSFADLDCRSNQWAHFLRQRGLQPGDRLAVYLGNCVEFIDILLACLKTAVVLVPVNVLYREREIAHILTDADPVAVLTTQAARAAIPAHWPVWALEEIAAAINTHSTDHLQMSLTSESPAAIVYTSGTTGRSKGAVLTHANFVANTNNLMSCWKITAQDRYLAVLPLFHVHGLGNGIMSWLASGCTLRLIERFDLARLPQVFQEFKPSLFFGVPTMYVRLLELTAELAAQMGQSMRLFVSGSAPLSAQVHGDFKGKFGHTILERYGMSETLMLLGNPYAGERRAGTVGQAFPGVQVKMVDGELWVKGPNVTAGYWRSPDANEKAFEGGWFKTGDIAACSEDGYYTLHGRRSDLIISGGYNIYPREIEELLQSCPGVREAAVVGVPDALRGELPVAFIVADAGLDTEALATTCRQQLASFKTPRQFIKVDQLPRNALGKLQKHLLLAPTPTT